MALVDYSDSDSDSESVAQQPAAKPAPTAASSSSATAKKPVQKVVDRSNPRRIVVNLGATATPDESKANTDSNEPPAKKARTGGGVFGGFASLLPPPKNRAQASTQNSGASSSTKAPPRVGVNLKTGATPGFSRSTGDDEGDEDGASNKQPSIPEGQKPAEDVALVGKPLMFKPLSVSRKPKKNVAAKMAAAPRTEAPVNPALTAVAAQASEEPPMKKKKKVSLFSIAAETDDAPEIAPSSSAYEPMFPEESASATDDFAAYDAQYSSAYGEPQSATNGTPTATTMQADSLESIASDMNLDAAARRALFGRRGVPAPTQSASRVINFNTDQEYAHNEELRASGEQQIYNPVRAIAPGKHSLRQLVNQVHNQKDALEESFAKGKSNQKEAGQRYGWR